MNAETTDNRRDSVWASSLNIVAGIWLIVSPFVLVYANGTAQVNEIVLGAVIGVFGLIRALAPGAGTAWLSWLNAACGVWLIIASFVLGYAGTARSNEIILGIIVLVVAVWSALSANVTRPLTPVAR